MIDRVELVLVDQPLEVRELQRDHAFGLQKLRHPGREVVEIGYLRQHIVADDQVGALALGGQLRCELAPEEVDQRRDALVDGDLGDIGGRLDADHGHLQRREVLQQVAVVAGELHREALRPEAQPLRDRLAVALGVCDPAGRIGGEVGVFPEDMLRAHVLFELH